MSNSPYEPLFGKPKPNEKLWDEPSPKVGPAMDETLVEGLKQLQALSSARLGQLGEEFSGISKQRLIIAGLLVLILLAAVVIFFSRKNSKQLSKMDRLVTKLGEMKRLK